MSNQPSRAGAEAPAPPGSPPPKLGQVITFYSYKGGVGRSMALANVAALLARDGKRVLVVDWDLEAPGLEKYFFRPPGSSTGSDTQFLSEISRAASRGIVDLIDTWREMTEPGSSPESQERGRAVFSQERLPDKLDWRPCVLRCKPFSIGSSIGLISAGQDTEKTDREKSKIGPKSATDSTAGNTYIQKVQSLDWNALFARNQIGLYFERLRDEWRREYEFVLIDSRTGLSDSGSICTSLLPDQLIVLFTANKQSIDGVLTAVTGARAAQKSLRLPRHGLPVVPVPARDEPYNEKKLSDEWREAYAKKFTHLYEEWAFTPPDEDGLVDPVKPSQILNKLYIPYASYWSFGERLPVLDEAELENPAKLGAAYARLKSLICSGLNWSSLESGPGVDEVERARAQASHAQKEAEEKHRELQRQIDRGNRRRRIVLIVITAVSLLAVFGAYGLYTIKAREVEIQSKLLAIANDETEPSKLDDLRTGLDWLRRQLPAHDVRLINATRTVAQKLSYSDRHDDAIDLYEHLLAAALDSKERLSLLDEIVYQFSLAAKPQQAINRLETARDDQRIADSTESRDAIDELLIRVYSDLQDPQPDNLRKVWDRLVKSRCEHAGGPVADVTCRSTRVEYVRALLVMRDLKEAETQLQALLADIGQKQVLEEPPVVDVEAALRRPLAQDVLRLYSTLLRNQDNDKRADELDMQLKKFEGLKTNQQDMPRAIPGGEGPNYKK